MDRPAPFVMFDDARGHGGGRLLRDPVEMFVARDIDAVLPVLAAADAARAATGQTVAGYLAYEAGYAFEPRLRPLAPARTGADGPLVWLARFARDKRLTADAVARWLAGQSDGPASIGPMTPALSHGGYDAAFALTQDAIAAGDIYQANLTFPLTGPWRGNPIGCYATLRRQARAGHGALMFDGADWLLSCSPESFFAFECGVVTTRPMKGTRQRGADPAADRALARELAASAKDRAENLMIVDLLRNDLARVAVPGTVAVPDAFVVETYPQVHQLVSTVTARALPGIGAMDVLRALFPCGSITGAPKIRAMEWIAAVERDPRGPYCGAIGWIDGAGDAAFNVAIRTLRLSPGEGSGRAVLGVGSGIVADSVAAAERRECLVKGGFVQGSAANFDLIETMRFMPDDGIELLDLHLERLKRSAGELGFAFDRHLARNRIQALCFELEAPARIRLLLARSGAMGLETAALPPAPDGPVPCAVLPLPVDPADWRLRHKSTDREFYDDARAIGEQAGAGEVLMVRDDGLVTEGSRTTVFVEREGTLLTPPAALGLQPGVLRQMLLAQGRAQETQLTLDDLAGGFMIGNAVRGLAPARLIA